MKGNTNAEPTSGRLTDKMDIGTDAFKDFQAIMLNKAKNELKKISSDKSRKFNNYSIKDLIN